MEGMLACWIDRLKRWVRYWSPWGPRCLRWWMVRPSGPGARELPLSRMALETESIVKRERLVSRGCDLMRFLLTRLAEGSDAWGTIEVNCLLKAVAIVRGVDRVLLLKVIGWLGAVRVLLEERDLRRDQKREVLCLCEHVSTVCIHFFRLDSDMSLEICRSRTCMCGCVGFEERRESRSRISRLVESGRSGMWLGICPLGMKCREEVRRMRRNWTSPVLQDGGWASCVKALSVSRVYEVQSALRKLSKVRLGRSGVSDENEP